MKRDIIPSWSIWIIGTVVTAILPFLVAFYRYGSSDFEGNYFDYVGLIDTLAFLFSVSVNCLLLGVDSRKITNIHFKRVITFFSLILAFFTGGWYFFLSGDGVDNKNYGLLSILIILSVINLVMGILHEYLSNKNQMKMESCSDENN